MELNRYSGAIAAVESDWLKSQVYACIYDWARHTWQVRYAEAESVFRILFVGGTLFRLDYIGLAQVLLRTGRAEEAVADLSDAEKKLDGHFPDQLFS